MVIYRRVRRRGWLDNAVCQHHLDLFIDDKFLFVGVTVWADLKRWIISRFNIVFYRMGRSGSGIAVDGVGEFRENLFELRLMSGVEVVSDLRLSQRHALSRRVVLALFPKGGGELVRAEVHGLSLEVAFCSVRKS